MEPVTLALALLRLGIDTARATGLLKTAADRQLESVGADVRALIVAPLDEAMLRLSQAAVTSDKDRRRALLDEARSRSSDVVARPTAPAAAQVAAGSCSPPAR